MVPGPVCEVNRVKSTEGRSDSRRVGGLRWNAVERHLDWEGCWNVRDLGGLPTTDGRVTRFGQIVRSDDPRNLTASGWAALRSHGVRTIVSLRSLGAEEDEPDAVQRPTELANLRVHVEDFGDKEFMDELLGKYREPELWRTPLFYRDALARWPERSAAAVSAVANAAPGGVLVHCGVGRDRTGLVTMLLLALARVAPEAIIADYELTYERMRAAGNDAEVIEIEQIMQRHGATIRGTLFATLEPLDAEALLRGGGASADELGTIRARLVG